MRLFQSATLLVATMTTGLMAGAFGLYAHTIMPGLGRTDDRTFVGAFQSIDRAVINRWFIPTFLGALVSTALARHAPPPRPRPLSAAMGRRGVRAVPTCSRHHFTVHVPRNDEIKAAGPPDEMTDPAAVRERFDETAWARWNVVRAATTTGALGCLAWALVLHGRLD
jgi:uncharacterized membrane protein